MGIRSVLRQARAQGWRDDTVEYAIFPDPDSFELPPPAPGQEAAGEEAVRRGLEALRVACLDVAATLAGDARWHLDPFQLWPALPLARQAGEQAVRGDEGEGADEEEGGEEGAEDRLPMRWRDTGDGVPWGLADDDEEGEGDEGEGAEGEGGADGRRGERGREGAPPHLYGRTRYGACVDDEWLVAWLLLAISARLPFLSIRLRDADGDFVLIEAADALPRWLSPSCSRNRLLLRQGRLHLVHPRLRRPPYRHASLHAALAAVRSAHEPTEASEKIHRAVMRRLEGLPGTALAAVHTARCRLPIRAAQVLHLDPSLVPLAAHAFLQSDHGSSTSPAPSFSRHSSSLPLFLPHSSCPCALASSRPGAPPCTTSPTPPPTAPSRAPPCTALVDVMVSFPRACFAQLSLRPFSPPRAFPLPFPSDPLYPSALLGSKLALGLELLRAAGSGEACVCECDEVVAPAWLGGEGGEGGSVPPALWAWGDLLGALTEGGLFQARPPPTAHSSSAAAGPAAAACVGAGGTEEQRGSGTVGGERRTAIEKEMSKRFKAVQQFAQLSATAASPAARIFSLLAGAPAPRPRDFPRGWLRGDDSERWMRDAVDAMERSMAARQRHMQGEDARRGGRGKKGGGGGDGMGEKGREGKSGKGGKQGKEGAEGEEEAGELVERLKQFLERASGFEGVEAGRDGDGSESGESEEGERGASEEEERRDGREEVERLREFELFMEDLEGVMAQYSHDEVKGFRGFRGDGSSEDEEDEGSESAFFSEPGSDSEWEDASHTGSLEGEGEESGEEEERGVGLPHEAVAGSGGAADAVGGGRAAQRAGRGAAAGGLRRGFLGAGGAPGGMQVVEERREEGEMRRRDKGKGKVVEEAVKEGRAGGASSGGVAGGDDFYALYSAAMAAQLAKTNVPKTSLALPPTHEQRSKLSSAASSSRAGRAAPGRAGEREAEAEAEAERVVGHLRMAQQLQGGLPGPADVLLDAVGAGKRGRGGRGKRGGRKGRR
ncbi:hypothetical protein CLOM_g16963 [Closterium sp. NIES-68]|nr:hypothetical protein CLOM_g16963 [Closterium sp. NIES-68]